MEEWYYEHSSGRVKQRFDKKDTTDEEELALED
jgi:hypothetical protein